MAWFTLLTHHLLSGVILQVGDHEYKGIISWEYAGNRNSTKLNHKLFVCLFAPNKLHAMTSDGRVVSRCFVKAALRGEQGLFGGNSSCPTYTSIYQERTLTSNALEGTSRLSTGRCFATVRYEQSDQVIPGGSRW